jgi:RNA polymerase sigma factor (sigma-70 family)
MKLTQKHLRDFFPVDMRFTHYVAKYYGYSFHKSEHVERATFNAKIALLKWYQEGKDFESKEHLYGMVMSRFRYAIMGCYQGNRNEQNLDVRPDSEFIFSNKKGDEFNTVDFYAPKEYNSYENNIDDLYETLRSILNPIEAEVLKLRYENQYTPREIAEELSINTGQVRTVIARIQTRYRKLNKKIKLQEYEYSPESKDAERLIQQNNIRIQSEARIESFRANEEARERYNEAMSWLDS